MFQVGDRVVWVTSAFYTAKFCAGDTGTVTSVVGKRSYYVMPDNPRGPVCRKGWLVLDGDLAPLSPSTGDPTRVECPCGFKRLRTC